MSKLPVTKTALLLVSHDREKLSRSENVEDLSNINRALQTANA